MNTAVITEVTPFVISIGEIQASITFADSADPNIVEAAKKMLLANYQTTME